MFVYGYSQYLWPLIMTTSEQYWTVVMGMKIKKAGIFKNPILKGKLIFKYVPEIRKPKAPNTAIKKPIAAALPMALLIE